MSIDEYAQLVWEEIVDVVYNMVELVDLTWGREVHLGLSLIEESLEQNDVDDHPTSKVNLPQSHEYAQLLSNFAMEHSSKFLVVDVMSNQSFMNTMNKISISNMNKHQQKTLDPYFRSV